MNPTCPGDDKNAVCTCLEIPWTRPSLSKLLQVELSAFSKWQPLDGQCHYHLTSEIPRVIAFGIASLLIPDTFTCVGDDSKAHRLPSCYTKFLELTCHQHAVNISSGQFSWPREIMHAHTAHVNTVLRYNSI